MKVIGWLKRQLETWLFLRGIGKAANQWDLLAGMERVAFLQERFGTKWPDIFIDKTAREYCQRRPNE